MGTVRARTLTLSEYEHWHCQSTNIGIVRVRTLALSEHEHYHCQSTNIGIVTVRTPDRELIINVNVSGCGRLQTSAGSRGAVFVINERMKRIVMIQFRLRSIG